MGEPGPRQQINQPASAWSDRYCEPARSDSPRTQRAPCPPRHDAPNRLLLHARRTPTLGAPRDYSRSVMASLLLPRPRQSSTSTLLLPLAILPISLSFYFFLCFCVVLCFEQCFKLSCETKAPSFSLHCNRKQSIASGIPSFPPIHLLPWRWLFSFFFFLFLSIFLGLLPAVSRVFFLAATGLLFVQDTGKWM